MSSRNAIGDLSDPALVATLTGWLEQSGASELEIATSDGQVLRIAVTSGAVPAAPRVATALPAETAAPPAGKAIKAPIAGYFRDVHPGAADAAPLAVRGGTVEAGAVVGFVEVGPILLPVVAGAKAVVADVLARAGDLVGYGDAIFTTEPVE